MKNPNLNSTRKGVKIEPSEAKNEPSQAKIEPSQENMEPKFQGKLQSKSRERETGREGASFFNGDTMKLGEAETSGGNRRQARRS